MKEENITLYKIYKIAKQGISSKEDISELIGLITHYGTLSIYDSKRNLKYTIVGGVEILYIMNPKHGVDIESGFSNDEKGLEIYCDEKVMAEFLWKNCPIFSKIDFWMNPIMTIQFDKWNK